MAEMMHVLGTFWPEDGAPSLRVWDGQLKALPLEGELDWLVADRRTCTGYWADTWHPCPDEAEVGGESQCTPCFQGRDPDAPQADDLPGCIFEPVCGGDPAACTCTFGKPAHAVYLAFYGKLPKVGMTLASRVRTRLMEQGADAYFVAAHVPGVADADGPLFGRVGARAIETRLARLHGLPEWRTYKETLPQLTRAVPVESIEDVASGWQDRLRDGGLDPGPLIHLEHSLPQPLPGRPHRVRTVGHHNGRWLGAKGSHLFYAQARKAGTLDVGLAPVAAIKRGDLIGRWISVGE